MKPSVRRYILGAVLAGVSLGNIGCQTYQIGQVLPSPYHIRDDIQYFPKGPDFPLANELNAMQAAEAERGGDLINEIP
jgi:hypothetical protein